MTDGFDLCKKKQQHDVVYRVDFPVIRTNSKRQGMINISFFLSACCEVEIAFHHSTFLKPCKTSFQILYTAL